MRSPSLLRDRPLKYLGTQWPLNQIDWSGMKYRNVTLLTSVDIKPRETLDKYNKQEATDTWKISHAVIPPTDP